MHWTAYAGPRYGDPDAKDRAPLGTPHEILPRPRLRGRAIPDRVSREALDEAAQADGGRLFSDSLDAIHSAAREAAEAFHDLAGIGRRSGHFGYLFMGRCRACGCEVVITRNPGGWTYPAPIAPCPVRAARPPVPRAD